MANDPVFKKDKVYQRFNLKEMFGVDMADFPEIKEAIGQAIIEKILARTAKGEGIGGKAFAERKYSPDYEKSLAFKAAGKRKGQKPDMKLTGDMLDLLDIIEQGKNTITVGWDDELQSAKAYNHNTGDTVPERPFFGLSKSEQKEIARMFKAEVKEAVQILKKEGRDPYTEKIMALIDKVKDELGDDE
jgi:phage gpG-like protein